MISDKTREEELKEEIENIENERKKYNDSNIRQSLNLRLRYLNTELKGIQEGRKQAFEEIGKWLEDFERLVWRKNDRL